MLPLQPASQRALAAFFPPNKSKHNVWRQQGCNHISFWMLSTPQGQGLSFLASFSIVQILSFDKKTESTKAPARPAQRVALHQQKKASCCQALAGARPHLSWKAWHLSIACKQKLVTQVLSHLRFIFSASRKALNFLVALWGLDQGHFALKSTRLDQSSKVLTSHFLQQASFISNSVAHVATPLPDALMLSFHGWHRHCCSAKTNEIWASYGAPTQLPQSRTRPWLSSETS